MLLASSVAPNSDYPPSRRLVPRRHFAALPLARLLVLAPSAMAPFPTRRATSHQDSLLPTTNTSAAYPPPSPAPSRTPSPAPAPISTARPEHLFGTVARPSAGVSGGLGRSASSTGKVQELLQVSPAGDALASGGQRGRAGVFISSSREGRDVGEHSEQIRLQATELWLLLCSQRSYERQVAFARTAPAFPWRWSSGEVGRSYAAPRPTVYYVSR